MDINMKIKFIFLFSAFTLFGIEIEINEYSMSKYNPDSEINKCLKVSSVGAKLYFSGVFIDYGLTGFMLFSDMHIDLSAIIILKLSSIGLELVGVPLACSPISKTGKICESDCLLLIKKPIAWTLYKTGWLFEGTGTLFQIMGLYNLNSGNYNAGLIELIIGASCSIGRDVVWGAACIKSLNYIKKVNESMNESKGKLTIKPYTSNKKTFGISCSYNF
jgi:hypothetical protein